MPAPRAPTTGGVALLERAIGYAMGCVHAASETPLSAPTPCEGWDFRALVAHMNDSLAALREAIDAGSVGIEPAGEDARDPLRTLRDQACQLLGAWTNGDQDQAISIAGCPITTNVVASTGALEIVVHGWDVAQACGTDRPVPPALALELLRLAPILVTDDDRPGRFGPALRASPCARPSDRLVAFLGRHP